MQLQNEITIPVRVKISMSWVDVIKYRILTGKRWNQKARCTDSYRNFKEREVQNAAN